VAKAGERKRRKVEMTRQLANPSSHSPVASQREKNDINIDKSKHYNTGEANGDKESGRVFPGLRRTRVEDSPIEDILPSFQTSSNPSNITIIYPIMIVVVLLDDDKGE